ncbi:MAG TPA: hypothetical protein VGK44_18775 [Casimicrobiaceae bacterium]|jgi:hypothetical protein
MPARVRIARTVPTRNAFAWYREAMRLWKRGPATFGVLALGTLAVEFTLSLIPNGGILLAQVAVPLAACGLLYGSLAADRGGRPRFGDFIAIVGAPPRALMAVIVSGLIVFAAEALTAYAIDRINMLTPASNDDITPGVAFAIYTVGIAVSLPFTFVPFGALFDGLSLRDSFAQSMRGFAGNLVPMCVYGLLSLMLLLLGSATFAVGFLLALPWWAASSYAAWKDIFGVVSESDIR